MSIIKTVFHKKNIISTVKHDVGTVMDSQASILIVLVPSLDKWKRCDSKDRKSVAHQTGDLSAAVTPREIREQLKLSTCVLCMKIAGGLILP